MVSLTPKISGFSNSSSNSFSIDGHFWYLGGLSAGGVGYIAALIWEGNDQILYGDLSFLE